jgi:hypothetical protein
MPNCSRTFSTTDIHIIEKVLRRIKEAQESFGRKFYSRLMREIPRTRLFLHSISIRLFTRNMVQSLDGIMEALRCQEYVTPPLKKFWPELSTPLQPSLEPSEVIKVADTFLSLVSELVGEAWNASLELTWRKAVNAVVLDWGVPLKESSTGTIRRIAPSIENGFINPTACVVACLESGERAFDTLTYLAPNTNAAYFNLGKHY